jgi:hypothetical protein
MARGQDLLGVEVPRVRKDGRDTCAEPVPLDDRPVAHLHARDVDERVRIARREAADGEAQLTEAPAHSCAA